MNRASRIQTARIVSLALAAAVFADTLTIFAQDAASTAIADTFSPEVGLSLGVPLRSSDNLGFGAVAQAPQAPAGEPSASEDIWTVPSGVGLGKVVILYAALQHLSPQDDAQAALKSQATAQAVDLAQVRSLIAAQSVPSVSKAMLIIVVSWVVVILSVSV